MALSGTMQCLKMCGFFCGILSVLNIWFWFGMTVFSAMGNTYLSFEFEGYELGEQDNPRFTMIYGVCIAVSISPSCQ